MTEPSRFSRRDFLKVATIGGAALGVAALGQVGLAVLNASERDKRPDFLEVAGRSSLPLKIDGVEQASKVAVNYLSGGVPVETMNVRVSGILLFESGATTRRLMGEILDNNLVRVRRSSLYPEGGINLHKSPATMGPIDSDMVLTLDEGLYGLPVITAVEYVIRDRTLPHEINNNPATEPREFSKGWAVGKISEANRVKAFNILGYVCDGRILEPVSK